MSTPRATFRPAFTLLELALVIVIIGFVAAIAWPDFAGASEREQLPESARRVEALAAMCRAEALNEACRYRVSVLADGSLRISVQPDPVGAPERFVPLRAPWAMTDVLLDGVWIEAVQMLPHGPAPIRIVDDDLEFPETEYEWTAVADLERPMEIEFTPDGSVSSSFRWVLRDRGGAARLVTLDARLGRVTTERWDAIAADDVERPDALEEEPEQFVVDQNAEQRLREEAERLPGLRRRDEE